MMTNHSSDESARPEQRLQRFGFNFAISVFAELKWTFSSETLQNRKCGSGRNHASSVTAVVGRLTISPVAYAKSVKMEEHLLLRAALLGIFERFGGFRFVALEQDGTTSVRPISTRFQERPLWP